jgi:hypothetical protein
MNKRSLSQVLIAFSFDNYHQEKRVYAHCRAIFGDSPAVAFQRANCDKDPWALINGGITWEVWEKDTLVLAFKAQALMMLSESTSRHELQTGYLAFGVVIGDMLTTIAELRNEIPKEVQ